MRRPVVKVLKIFGIGIAGIIAMFVGVSFFLPDTYHVERTISINAAATQIHRLTSDLQHGWPQWEPWGEADESVEMSYGNVTAGVGARQNWKNKDGNGSLTITASDATHGVEYDMAFNVDQYIARGKLTYAMTSTGTDVTWQMDGDVGGVSGKYFGYMMDSMVGPMFEKGLANLKAAAEALPPIDDEQEEERSTGGVP
jgi:hypothetical protein